MTTTILWLSLVQEAEPDLYKPYVAYEFGGGREFLSTDKGSSGIYGSGLRDSLGDILKDSDGEVILASED